MSIIDFEAAQKWSKIPKEMQQRFINNVFCSSCYTTTIEKFTIHSEDGGVLLKGKCKKCNDDVARFIELEG